MGEGVYFDVKDRSYLYQIWVAFVCLSDDVCNQKCYRVTHLNISAKWSQIFTKTSAIMNIVLGSRLKLFAGVYARKRAHAHAQRTSTCTQLITVIAPLNVVGSLRKLIRYCQGIKDAPYVLGRAHDARKRVRIISFKHCIIWGWPRKWKLLKRSNVYSLLPKNSSMW